LSLSGRAPGQLVTVFVEADSVQLADGPARNGTAHAGVFVAPDQRGGSWVRVDGRLLRSAAPQGARQPGAPGQVVLEGAPRELEVGGAGNGRHGAART